MGINIIINSIQEIIKRDIAGQKLKYCTKSFKETSQLII